jgi:hypothetical protein
MSRGRGASDCPPPALHRGPARLQRRGASGRGGVKTRAPDLAQIRRPPGVNVSFPYRFGGDNAAAVVDLGTARSRGRAGSNNPPTHDRSVGRPKQPAPGLIRQAGGWTRAAECRIWGFRDGFVVDAGWASMARRRWGRLGEEPVRGGEGTGEGDRPQQETGRVSYGPPWAHYLGGYQDRLLGGPLGLPYLRYTAPEGVEHKDNAGVVLG